MKSWLLILAAAAAAQAQKNVRADCTKAPLSQNGVCDTSLSPAKRAAALVAAMTSDEKLQNLVSLSKGASRLGLPAYNWWSEALHGVAAAPGVQFTHGDLPFNTTTSFPMPLLMASAFDDELIEQVGVAIGTEGRAFGNFGFSGFDFWTPNVNPFRDPRWGRGSETAGEDILRIKRYADSMIRGMQGPKENPRVIATCKHFAANDIESWHGTTRHNFDAKLTAQDMAEYYLMPFQQCARDSKVGSIMCAYNAVNGIPSCANSYLMNTIVRDHWNWTEHNNYITSDCEAVADIYNPHHYANSLAAATADAFNAGMDTSCEYSGSSDIPGAWNQGLLKIETVNRALLRLYEGLVWVGYFDGTNATYGKLDWSDVDTPSSQSVARAAAAESIMLLKNDGTLPLTLTPNKTTVAMIGFWADSADEMSGGYSGTPAYRHSPVYIAKQLGLSVTQASGPILQTTAAADNWTTPALTAANSSDYIIYFGGLDTTAAGEGADRLTLNWPTAQVALVQKLAALGKPLVVVQLGDPIDETPMLVTKGVNSLLYVNYPSQEGSAALWEIISGAVAPAGRLPVTLYPENYTAVDMTDMTLRPSATNPGRTYRWFPSPVMEFGFGMHYTTFKTSLALCAEHTYAIADLVKGCSNTYLDTCPFAPLPVEVSNHGKHTSDFVVLAFVAGEYGPKPYPIKTLASYARVKNVEPGKSKTVKLKWSLGDIARHDEMGNTVLYPGTYTVLIDVPTQSELNITLTGEPLVLDKWPALPGANGTASA